MSDIEHILNERILVLDGAMGTMIESYKPNEAHFRGERFAKHDTNLHSCYDILNITAPHIIEQIHRQYLDAGADIITTNTFNSNAISLAAYNLKEIAGEINQTATILACRIADYYTQSTPDKPRFVAGSVGPTTISCSTVASNTETLLKAYTEQITALIAGGVDILLIETICDLKQVQAALQASEHAMTQAHRTLPIMLSITTTPNGTMLSGDTLDTFVTSVCHAPILSVGINCSYGATTLLPQLRTLSRIAPCYTSTHPSAGIPDTTGRYHTTAIDMAKTMQTFIDEGLVNIVGGCCGTTPQLTALLCQTVKGVTPRIPTRKQ